MKLSFKKVLVLLAFLGLLPIVFSGCQKKSAHQICKTDADCRLDASGKEINGVCYMGKCEECAKDSDCTDLKQCVNNRCLSACQADADCGVNSHCENSYCVADCSNNDGCPGGHVCASGRCVAQAGGDPNAWAQGDCQSLQNIQFDFDRYDVKDEYRAHVSKLAKCLETNPGYSVVIEGHTDNRGTPSYNMALGQKRADAVKAGLVNLGIASSLIKTVSHGETKPVVDESTEYAWQQNRRADFVLQRN